MQVEDPAKSAEASPVHALVVRACRSRTGRRQCQGLVRPTWPRGLESVGRETYGCIAFGPGTIAAVRAGNPHADMLLCMTLESWFTWLSDPRSVGAIAVLAVAVVAAVAAWVSAISARTNLKTARQQLGIALAGEARKREPLRCNIEAANSIQRSDVTHYVFRLRIDNPSDSPNSITTAQLRLHYLGTDGRAVEAKFDPSADVPSEWIRDSSLIEVPAAIASRESVRGGFAYAVPGEFTRAKDIKRFSIDIMDAEERQTSPEILLMTPLKVGNETH